MPKRSSRRTGLAVKISATLDPKTHRQAVSEARRRGISLSAHISEALAREQRQRGLAELIAQYEAEHGVISMEEVAKARAAWRG